MPCSAIACAWSASSRTASRPPWTLGCSVLTRPSIISGKPVRSETSRTVEPRVAQRLGGAAGRDQFDAVPRQRRAQFGEPALVRHRQQGPGDLHVRHDRSFEQSALAGALERPRRCWCRPPGVSPVTTSCGGGDRPAAAVDPDALLDRERAAAAAELPQADRRRCAAARRARRRSRSARRRGRDGSAARSRPSAPRACAPAGSSMSSPPSSRPSADEHELAAVLTARSGGHSRHGSPRSGSPVSCSCRSSSTSVTPLPSEPSAWIAVELLSAERPASNARRWCAAPRRSRAAERAPRPIAAAIDDQAVRPVATSRTPASRRSRRARAARPAAARNRRRRPWRRRRAAGTPIRAPGAAAGCGCPTRRSARATRSGSTAGRRPASSTARRRPASRRAAPAPRAPAPARSRSGQLARGARHRPRSAARAARPGRRARPARG